ncbi:MAG: patatin-like phospholipase family protein [Eubacterium sp.]
MVTEEKIGLVLEGGGMRGIYTAGVLDVFMDHGIVFDGVIGVSAGAIHGSLMWQTREGAISGTIRNTAMTNG